MYTQLRYTLTYRKLIDDQDQLIKSYNNALNNGANETTLRWYESRIDALERKIEEEERAMQYTRFAPNRYV